MRQGTRVLVIEDQFIIALEIQYVLGEAGASVELLRSRAEMQADIPVDLVIMDAHLGAPEAVAFCAMLVAQGIAVVVTSADSRLRGMFAGAEPLEKPFGTESLLAACEAALARRQP